MSFRYSGYLLVGMLICDPWLVRATAQDRVSLDAIDLDATLPLDKLAAQLVSKRVVFVAEIHSRYDHHLNQLEIIRRLFQLYPELDRKSTRLNSSHPSISYAVFCLKKKKKK